MTSSWCQRHFVQSVMCNSSHTGERPRARQLKLANIGTLPKRPLDVDFIVDIIKLTMRTQRPAPKDPKEAALRAAGALHPHPTHVTDELFMRAAFFDRRDRVQVKYEMLRARDVDGRRISEVARAFGTSRQALYAAAATFQAQGILGLLPRPRGPKRAHKCTDEILDFAEQWRAEETPKERNVVDAIRDRFGVAIHPRSLQRALARRAKKDGRNGARRA